MNDAPPASPFAGLLERGRLSLTPALQHAGVLLYVAGGEDLFLEGEPAREFLMVASGRVKLWRTLEDGSACALMIVGAGETLGAVAVAQNVPQLTSATAMDDVTLLAWNATFFRAELENRVEFATSFLRIVADRAHKLLDRFSDITAATVEERLARTLVRLAAEFGPHPERRTLVIAVRQQDLADMALTTVPTVSRCLSRWQGDGILASARGRVEIRDLHRLALAGGLHLD